MFRAVQFDLVREFETERFSPEFLQLIQRGTVSSVSVVAITHT